VLRTSSRPRNCTIGPPTTGGHCSRSPKPPGAPGQHARAAAGALEAVELTTEDLCIELLADIRATFEAQTDPQKREVLFSMEILRALVGMPERPWVEAGKNERPLTTRGMSVLLKAFNLKTNKNVRRGRDQAKGFERAEFEGVFESYLPPLEGSHRSHGPTPRIPRVSSHSYQSHNRSQHRSHSSCSVGTDLGTDRGTDCGTDTNRWNVADSLAWDPGGFDASD
jgi:hypothetical protein